MRPKEIVRRGTRRADRTGELSSFTARSRRRHGAAEQAAGGAHDSDERQSDRRHAHDDSSLTWSRGVRIRVEATDRSPASAAAFEGASHWVRVTCPACGVVRVRADRVVVRHCLDDQSWSYRALCSQCDTMFVARTPSVARAPGDRGRSPRRALDASDVERPPRRCADPRGRRAGAPPRVARTRLVRTARPRGAARRPVVDPSRAPAKRPKAAIGSRALLPGPFPGRSVVTDRQGAARASRYPSREPHFPECCRAHRVPRSGHAARSGAAALLGIPASTLLALIFGSSVPASRRIAFVAFVSVADVVTMAVRRPLPRGAGVAARSSAAIGSGSAARRWCGLAWGSPALFALPGPQNVDLRAVYLLFVCGTSATYVVGTAARRLYFHASQLPMLLPVGIVFMLSDDRVTRLLGFAVPIYFFVMMSLHHEVHGVVVSELQLREHNDEANAQLRVANEQLTRRALRDELTGLANRAAFVDTLQQRGCRCARERVDRRGAVLRRRPAQGGERLARSRDGRHAPGADRRARPPNAAEHRRAGSPRWRRIHDVARQAPQQRGSGGDRGAGRAVVRRAVPGRRTADQRVREHRRRDERRTAPTMPKCCCRSPTPRSTGPSRAAGTASRSSTSSCAPRSSRGSTTSTRCAPASPTTRSSRGFNPRSISERGATSARRHWPGGITPSAVCSMRGSSFRSPKRPAWCSRSTTRSSRAR